MRPPHLGNSLLTLLRSMDGCWSVFGRRCGAPFLPSHTSSLGGEGWGEADTDGDEADEGKREGKVRPGKAEDPLFTLFGLEHIMACVYGVDVPYNGAKDQSSAYKEKAFAGGSTGF